MRYSIASSTFPQVTVIGEERPFAPSSGERIFALPGFAGQLFFSVLKRKVSEVVGPQRSAKVDSTYQLTDTPPSTAIFADDSVVVAATNGVPPSMERYRRDPIAFSAGFHSNSTGTPTFDAPFEGVTGCAFSCGQFTSALTMSVRF